MSVDVCSVGDGDTKPQNRRPYTISLGNLTKHNLKQLRTINSTIFPVEYSENYYKNVMKPGNYCKLAYFNDILVGAVGFRIDNIAVKEKNITETPSAPQKLIKTCYIMTLGCLSQFREFGVGSKMLDYVIMKCQQLENIHSIYLNVHVENDVAIKFYQNKGFEIVEEVPNYYLDITPSAAFVLEKKLEDCEKIEMSDDDCE